jgi:hypothetical protein
MAIHEIESQTAPEIPKPLVVKEVLDDGCEIYRFFVEDQDLPVTLTREQLESSESDYTYHFKFFGWEYGEADVHADAEAVAIEWCGIEDDLKDLAQIQAQKLMTDSDIYLLTALANDFPGRPIEDVAGNPLH